MVCFWSRQEKKKREREIYYQMLRTTMCKQHNKIITFIFSVGYFSDQEGSKNIIFL